MYLINICSLYVLWEATSQNTKRCDTMDRGWNFYCSMSLCSAHSILTYSSSSFPGHDLYSYSIFPGLSTHDWYSQGCSSGYLAYPLNAHWSLFSLLLSNLSLRCSANNSFSSILFTASTVSTKVLWWSIDWQFNPYTGIRLQWGILSVALVRLGGKMSFTSTNNEESPQFRSSITSSM